MEFPDFTSLREGSVMIATDDYPICDEAEEYFLSALRDRADPDDRDPIVTLKDRVVVVAGYVGGRIMLFRDRVETVLQKPQSMNYGNESGIVLDDSALNGMLVWPVGRVFLAGRPLFSTADTADYNGIISACLPECSPRFPEERLDWDIHSWDSCKLDLQDSVRRWGWM